VVAKASKKSQSRPHALYANALNNENNFNVLSVSETLSNWKSVHAEMTSSITEMFTLIGK